MVAESVEIGEPPARVAPVGTLDARPPRSAVGRAHDVLLGRGDREMEDGGEPEALGLGEVAGLLDEAGEGVVGDGRGVDVEGAESDLVARRLPVGAVLVAGGVAHREGAGGEGDLLDRVAACAGRRCRAGGRNGEVPGQLLSAGRAAAAAASAGRRCSPVVILQSLHSPERRRRRARSSMSLRRRAARPALTPQRAPRPGQAARGVRTGWPVRRSLHRLGEEPCHPLSSASSSTSGELLRVLLEVEQEGACRQGFIRPPTASTRIVRRPLVKVNARPGPVRELDGAEERAHVGGHARHGPGVEDVEGDRPLG